MKKDVVAVEKIVQTILIVNGEKVLLDADLARLYGVTTANLNKAVKRNCDRFPRDFMFQLSAEEAERLIFQFGISSLNLAAVTNTKAKIKK